MAANASQLLLCCLPASPPRHTYGDSLREHLQPDKLLCLGIAEFGSLPVECLPGTSHGVGRAAGIHGGVRRNFRVVLPLAVRKTAGWSEEYRQTPLPRSFEQQGDKEGRRHQLSMAGLALAEGDLTWATSVLNWRSGIAEHVVGDELEAESVCETLGPSLPHCFASKGMAMLQRQGLSRKDKQLIK